MPPKKSEFLKKFAELCKAGESVADAAAEAAGVVWDPEEPMAERLVACVNQAGSVAFRTEPWGSGGRWATEAEAATACALYNRRRAISWLHGEASAHAGVFRDRAGRGQGAEPADLLRWAEALEGKPPSDSAGAGPLGPVCRCGDPASEHVPAGDLSRLGRCYGNCGCKRFDPV